VSATGAAPTVVLFTESYPYHRAAEQTFLDPEMAHLARAFARVVLVPAAIGGARSDLPANVEVDDSLASSGSARGRWRRLAHALSPVLAGELATRPRVALDPNALRRLLAFLAQARSVREWLPRLLEARQIDTRHTVFYTYWQDIRTMGIALAKSSRPELQLVSRAHGSDLYEERQRPPYLPCRRRLLAALDRLYLVSEHGREYLRRRHPGAASRLRVSRLGVRDPRVLTSPSSDGVFRIVSCAYVVEVKRLDRLAEALAMAARAKPDQAFEWHHLGGGPLEEQLKAVAARAAPPNLRCHFLGNLSNAAVLAFYKERPVDLFANTSESEGLPVSIMEALSHGIPVLAPAVGGVPEIVDDETGVLLRAAPTTEEVAAGILRILEEGAPSGRRRGARRRWETTCDADRNFAQFADELRALIP
jgi:glycosyltransferase involved in cell wall biosynthesis